MIKYVMGITFFCSNQGNCVKPFNCKKGNEIDTHCEHILCKSLSVVDWFKPLIYKFVFESCSVCWGVVLGPIVLFVFVLLKLVLNVPLCDPVFDELLELVLLGDAAVGTRCPYCNEIKRVKNDT